MTGVGDFVLEVLAFLRTGLKSSSSSDEMTFLRFDPVGAAVVAFELVGLLKGLYYYSA